MTTIRSSETESQSPPLPSPVAIVTTTSGSKRVPPLFLPNVSGKKRRVGALVKRTHSPKTVPSPLSSPVIKRACKKTADCSINGSPGGGVDVHRLAPTVKGVAEGARVISSGQVVTIPTETTYYYCTTLELSSPKQQKDQEKRKEAAVGTNAATSTTGSTSQDPSPLLELVKDEQAPVMLLVRSPLEVDGVMTLLPKAYAIQSASKEKAIPPVSLHEGREVLHRLAARYWPGPLPIYLSCCFSGLSETSCHDGGNYRVEDKVKLPLSVLHQSPHCPKPDCWFLGCICPSHPLPGRVLNDVAVRRRKDKNNRVVLGATCSKSGEYLTKAHDVCQHLLSVPCSSSRQIHVLNGEDKREAFAVPTCQYLRPSKVGIWIHTRTRTVHIWSCAANDDDAVSFSQKDVQRALLQPLNDPKRPHRHRVVSAVLRKWTVMDHRSRDKS